MRTFRFHHSLPVIDNLSMQRAGSICYARNRHGTGRKPEPVGHILARFKL